MGTSRPRPLARFNEPATGTVAGSLRFVVPERPYETFMREEGIPVYRGIGVHDVRELSLAHWPRTNGRGAFIHLDGIESVSGMYVIEIPPHATLEPERHMYEELAFVVHGQGTLEVTARTGARTVGCEWHAGSLFGVPLNAPHRLRSTSAEAALLLVGTSAPAVMDLFGSGAFVFDNAAEFPERFDNAEDPFAYHGEILASPTNGRAMVVTSFMPDIVGCALPLDNHMSHGYRFLEPHIASGRQYLFIGEHQPGQYSRAHSHLAGAVLVCIKGKGYTYTWPKSAGRRPWLSGHADLVRRHDYVAGGMVSAAPGGGDWIHQHFGASAEPLRFLTLWGMRSPLRFKGRGGEHVTSALATSDEGGEAIPYSEEDPHIRQEFERMLQREGVASKMGREET